MPRGGSRKGAGRKPYPEIKPGGVVIDVHNATAYVSRWLRIAGGFQLQPAANWEALEDSANEEVNAVGGYITMSGVYPCSTALATQAQWEE